MSDNSFDIPSGMGYNGSNYDVNEAVVNHYLSQPQIVKMDEQTPINDAKCEHKNLVPDYDDTLGDAVYHGCSNPKCGVGYYLRTTNKNTS